MLKGKVKSVLTRFQREKSSDEDAKLDLPMMYEGEKEEVKKIDVNDIISEVDAEYFKCGSDVDCCEYELKKLGPEIDMTILEDRILQLKTQDNAMYKKIYDLVFANYTSYVQELENVAMLQLSLQHAARTCVNSRRLLKNAKEGVSHGGLGLLAKHRKRERLRTLLEILRALKTLQRTDAKLKELLKEGDYPEATQLCIECQNAIETYKHYSCVRELAVSLQDIQEDIERELSVALGQMCTKFNAFQYEQVYEAYQILGKTQASMDTLLMKFTTTIHDRAYAVVAEQIKLNGEFDPEETQHLKMPYSNLCKHVNPNHFIPCLMELCKMLWLVMHNYYQIKQWHEQYAQQSKDTDGSDLVFNRNYVKKKLEHGSVRLWRDVQQKVRPCVLGVDMSNLKYDDLIKVLGIVNRLISIGTVFCGEGSDTLQESMRQQSLKYFKNYHRLRLDELRLFLETEAWEPCPVRSTFNMYNLREFKFMKQSESDVLDSERKVSPSKSNAGIFSHLSPVDNPFELHDEDEEEDVMATAGFEETFSEDEKDDYTIEEKKEYEGGEHSSHLKMPPAYKRRRSGSSFKGPILANTTLSVLRITGRYAQMMSVLQPIAFDVLECLSQLFDYYLYAIYSFFATDLLDRGNVELSGKLTASLRRIEDKLLLQEDSSVLLRAETIGKFPRPQVCPVVELTDLSTLTGLRFRVVAVESLVFLASQFEALLTCLENLIPDSKKSFLTQFFSQTVTTAQELRKPVYCGTVFIALHCDQVLQSMSAVKWDIRGDIMSQHSSYVDILLQEFVHLKEQVSNVERTVPIPKQSLDMLWEHAIKLANKTFLEGFSQVKKCSNEGRALMQLDFQQYRTKLERLTNIRPIPNHSYVEDYIKAYYMSEDDTEKWIRQHPEYTAKQLQTLVVCGVGTRIAKRSRQKLLAVIDEMDRSR